MAAIVRAQNRAINAETAGHAGTLQLKQYNIKLIEMFRHPKYYKELRKLRNKLDQAISLRESETSAGERSPGPGLKPQAASDKQQAASHKRQASSSKPR